MQEFKDEAKKFEIQSSAIIQDHVKRPYILVDADKQEDWQQLPEIPSGEEILQAVPNSALPENPIPDHLDPGPKPWRDKAAYLSAQYKLLREDAIRPLKIACQEFMAAPDLGDSHQTSIYTHASSPCPPVPSSMLTSERSTLEGTLSRLQALRQKSSSPRKDQGR